jgi:cytochrome P450
MYVVTRYADIRAIAADTKTFINNTQQLQRRQTPATPTIERLMKEAGVEEVNTMVTNDPPSHRLYRTLVDKAFSPRRVAAIENRILEIANELIDGFPDGPFDFVQHFAIWLPMQMIAEQLGVPPEMGATFKAWSDATIEATDPRITPEQLIQCTRLKIEMNQFLAVRGDELRVAPDDTLISAIANATVDGRPLIKGEFCSLLVQLLVGGNETSTNALASGLYHLVSKPELQALLRAEPDKIKAFSEEVLRLESPLQGLFRRATAPVTIGGVELPEGAILNLRWAAGNRDPEAFSDPDEIVLDRPNGTQHLTFGFGIHYCIGNRLARAELRHAFTALLARSRSIRLVGGEAGITRMVHFMAYGPVRLEIEMEHA